MLGPIDGASGQEGLDEENNGLNEMGRDARNKNGIPGQTILNNLFRNLNRRVGQPWWQRHALDKGLFLKQKCPMAGCFQGERNIRTTAIMVNFGSFNGNMPIIAKTKDKVSGSANQKKTDENKCPESEFIF